MLPNHKIEDRAILFREDYPCVYFDDGRLTTTEYLMPDRKRLQIFHTFLAQGYRRLGRLFYRNVCKTCSACEPLRLELDKFTLSRSQKRTLRKNEDIRIKILSRPSVTPEKIKLYEKYIITKHADNKPGDPLPVLSAMHSGYDRIIEMDYCIGGKLIAVGIVDEAEDSLSSNYFYYDTDFLDRRPGVLSVIREIYLAKEMHKKYFYLGFYIADNKKMSYKNTFRPNQVYKKDKWEEFLSR
ncbi:MAG: arginyltransferase [Nitrospirae bacterium]|nr:arginyltransferase [Nitrospirota bacterium]